MRKEPHIKTKIERYKVSTGLLIGLWATLLSLTIPQRSLAEDPSTHYKLTDSSWDYATHIYIPTIIFSADGKTMVLAGSANNGKGRIHIWDLSTGKRKFVIDRSSAIPTLSLPRITAAAVTADNQSLITVHEKGYVNSWNLLTGKLQRSLHLPEHTQLKAIAISPDAKSIAIGGQNGLLQLLDAETFALKWTQKAHLFGLTAIAFNPDGSLIYSSGDDQHIYLWDTDTGTAHKPLHELKRASNLNKAHKGMIKTIAIVDAGKVGISGSFWEGGSIKSYETRTPADKTLRTWDLVSGKPLDSYPFTWGVKRIQPVANSSLILFINSNGWNEDDPTIKVFDLQSKKTVQTFHDDAAASANQQRGVQSFGIIPHTHVAVIGLRSGRYEIWDFLANKAVASFISTDEDWLMVNNHLQFDTANRVTLKSELALKELLFNQYKRLPGLLSQAIINCKQTDKL